MGSTNATYAVLEQNEDLSWVEIAEVNAHSSREAIRLALGGQARKGRFVGVPRRSWQPLDVHVETTTRLTFPTPRRRAGVES